MVVDCLRRQLRESGEGRAAEQQPTVAVSEPLRVGY